jgi:hypothetical protein
LGRHRPAGPCDDDCGCATDVTDVVVSPTRASVRLVTKNDATTSADVPVACTLAAGEMTGRLGEWQALLEAVTARFPLQDGVRLEFGADTAVGEIARLAAAEQDCCRFFRFAVLIDPRGVALEVHAPADAADVVTALFGAAT